PPAGEPPVRARGWGAAPAAARRGVRRPAPGQPLVWTASPAEGSGRTGRRRPDCPRAPWSQCEGRSSCAHLTRVRSPSADRDIARASGRLRTVLRSGILDAVTPLHYSPPST